MFYDRRMWSCSQLLRLQACQYQVLYLFHCIPHHCFCLLWCQLHLLYNPLCSEYLHYVKPLLLTSDLVSKLCYACIQTTGNCTFTKHKLSPATELFLKFFKKWWSKQKYQPQLLTKTNYSCFCSLHINIKYTIFGME